MPVAEFHFREGQYTEDQIKAMSNAVQQSLIEVLKIPSDDFFQLIFEMPEGRFLHTRSFLGLNYSKDLIVLRVTFIQGRPREVIAALHKELNSRIVAATGIAPDDLMTLFCELPGENGSFGRGESQRAGAIKQA